MYVAGDLDILRQPPVKCHSPSFPWPSNDLPIGITKHLVPSRLSFTQYHLFYQQGIIVQYLFPQNQASDLLKHLVFRDLLTFILAGWSFRAASFAIRRIRCLSLKFSCTHRFQPLFNNYCDYYPNKHSTSSDPSRHHSFRLQNQSSRL